MTLTESTALDYCAYCFDSIIEHLRSPPPTPLINIQTTVKAPLFVTFKKKSGKRSYSQSTTASTDEYNKLRGCIGTFTARPLANGLRDFAINAAFKDTRFQPVELSEIPSLECGVSILTDFETCTRWDDWEIGQHGISISYKQYNATYLPEIAHEQGWDHEVTITELLAKAGYRGDFTEHIKSEIRIERYQSMKAALSYPQYLEYKKIKAESLKKSVTESSSAWTKTTSGVTSSTVSK